MITLSPLLVCALLLAIGGAAVPTPALAQQPVSDRNPEETAWFVANRLDTKSTDRSNILAELAWNYYRLGHREKAVQILEQIPAGERGVYAIDLIEPAVKAGDSDFALRILQETWGAANRAKLNRSDRAWPIFARQFVALGHLEEAALVAEAIDDDFQSQTEALIAVTNGLVKDGQYPRAGEMADRVLTLIRSEGYNDQLSSIITLADLGAIYTAIGRHESAREALDWALRLADAEDDTNRDMFKSFVVRGLARARQFERATELAELLNMNERINAISFVAAEYANDGNRTEALALLDRASQALENDSEADHSYNRRDLMRGYLAANAPEQAETNLNAIRPGLIFNESALEIAEWYLQHSQRSHALRVLDRGAQHLHTIKLEGSNDIASEWDRPCALNASRAFGMIPRKYLALKEFDRAFAAINAIGLPYYQAELLADLARGLRADGQPAKALTMANRAQRLVLETSKYSSDANQLNTLANVAGAYGELGEQETSVRLFLRSLSLVGHADTPYQLARIGFFFQQANLKPNVRIQQRLQLLADQ